MAAGSFYTDNIPVETTTNPSAPADTPVSATPSPSPSSFFGGTGQPYANVTTIEATFEEVTALQALCSAEAASATASATAAAGSATAAATSATSASTSATNAATSATAAATSATSAASHDTSAAGHDSAAATSATNAAASATSASSSASAASTSATNAASSATAAASSATAASTSATNAANSATAAATSAANAATAADTEIAARAIRYDASQSLTGPQQTQARTNAGISSLSVTISGHALSLGGSLSLAASDVSLGSVTNDAQTKATIVPNTAPTAGQVLVGNAGNTAYAPVAVGGDATLSSAGALTVTKTNGTLFGTAATLNVGTGASQIVQMTAGTKLPAVDGSLLTNLPTAVVRGEIFGLAMSAPGAGTTLTINAGQATSDDFSTQMTLASTYTKTTASWAVGTAAGALDSGVISLNTWYHVFLIERTDTGVVDVLISVSASSPTMPTNYTKKRRIGAVRTDASSKFLGFTQLGDEFLWLTTIADMSATASATGAHSLTITVPSNVQVLARVMFGAVYSTASISALMYPLDSGTQTDNTPTLHYQLFVASTAVGAQADLDVRTNTSGQVGWTASGAGANLYCITYGWFDRRGRDA